MNSQSLRRFKKLVPIVIIIILIILTLKLTKSFSDFSTKLKRLKKVGFHDMISEKFIFYNRVMKDKANSFNRSDELGGPEDMPILVDRNDFEFTLNIPECGYDGEAPSCVFLIHTAIDHLERRDVIRTTWGQKKYPTRVVFLLGATNSKEDQEQIESEQEKYQDIVQGNFLDTYKNLTYKHVMGLKWATYYCQNCKYLVKVDDDTFVNTPYVLKYIDRLINYVDTKGKLVCNAWSTNPILRTKGDKWYVSYEEMNGTFYPTHCSGFAMFYSPEVACKIYKASRGQKFFWVDDAYVSGVLAARANVSHYQMDHSYIGDREIRPILTRQTMDPELPFLFGGLNLNVRIIKNLWTLVEQIDWK